MTKTDRDYLIEAEEVLAAVDCQFWACKGPTLFPLPMVTCTRCRVLARIRRHLGLPIGGGCGQSQLTEAQRRAGLARAVGR